MRRKKWKNVARSGPLRCLAWGLISLFGLLGTNAVIAQSNDEIIRYDSVVTAPDQHKVLLKTDDVRVLEVTIDPVVVEPLHNHRRPSVLYFQSAGDFIDRDRDGNILMVSRSMNPPLKFPATIPSKAKSVPHSIENLSEPRRSVSYDLS